MGEYWKSISHLAILFRDFMTMQEVYNLRKKLDRVEVGLAVYLIGFVSEALIESI